MPEGGTQAQVEAITSLLQELARGTSQAADRLLPLVYEDLHQLARGRIARLRPGQTIQVTDLVHEAWMRLIANGAPEFESRAHFFGAAANAMRRHMIEAARRKGSLKRDASRKEALGEDPDVEPGVPLGDVLAVHEALAKLEETYPRQARVVNLRFFAGLALPEVAELLGLSLATAERDWRFARAWLQREMGGGEP